jgi:hypothetical protein
MTFSIWSLAGLIAGAALGVGLLAAFNRFVYMTVSRRYEAAKVTGSTALNPRLLLLAAKLVALVILPVVGFISGHGLFS